MFDPPPRPRPGAPNVVMVLLDDLGFADLGSYGSRISTPAIDALAAQGLRYNNFHVTALCTPTRACLLTGRNHHAVGMGYLAQAPMTFPGYNARLPASAATLPRVLRDSGYNTLAVGKWHLIPPTELSPAGPFDNWPLGKGFERYYGFLNGATNQWTPDLVCDNGYIEPPASPWESYHLTEDLTDQAIRFVQDQQQAAPDKPFFLYYATGATHAPHQAPPEWIEHYRHQFDDGWDAMREHTFQRQRDVGVVPANTALTDRPRWVEPWDELPAGERHVLARQMEAYAAFLSHTDAQIGRLVDFLSRIGVLDNTLIMFLSDNGACAAGGPYGTFDPDHADEPGGFRAMNAYGWGWAWASNAPFPLWKTYTWLGGIRVPLIVRWPTAIPAESNGSMRTQFCHAIDLMPTILDATGLEAPDVVDGATQQPIDGSSILSTCRDAASPSPRDTQYFEIAGSRAIYHDGWMATTDHVLNRPADREHVDGSHDFDTDRWSLYHLDDDFAQAHDCADDHPEQLRRMIELWWHEAGRNNVLPLNDTWFANRTDPRSSPPTPVRDEFRYLPGGGAIRVPPMTSGFRLTAHIDVPVGDAPSGMVCAQGDWNKGWACYIRDGRLVVAVNLGNDPRHVVDDELIAAGTHKLEITYRPDAAKPAERASATLDGRDIDPTASLAATVDAQNKPARKAVFTAPMLIGRDTGFPVCDDYRPPFPFTGHIHSIALDVSNDQDR